LNHGIRAVYENVAFTKLVENSLVFHSTITVITLNGPSLVSVTLLPKISHSLDRLS